MRFGELHSRFVARFVRQGLEAFAPIAAQDIPPPATEADPALACLAMPDIGPAGIQVPFTDEDGYHRSRFVQTLISLANRLLPFRDEHREFPGDAGRFLTEAMGALLPQPHVTWPDLSDPDHLALFALQGIGAHRLERDREGVALRMEFLSPVPVRPSLARYGGDALIGEDGKLRALVFGEQRITPQHPEFAAYAFRFRSTVVSGVTVLDHLGTTHYGVSNALLVATRRRLGPAHPLRVWLKPFLFRTGATNTNTTATLLPERSLLHRGTGFVDLRFARARMLDGARYEPFPDALRRRGVHPEQLPPGLAARLPFSVDGLDFWNRLEAFVLTSFGRSAALAGVGTGGPGDATRAFWDDLGAQLPGGLPGFSLDALGRVLTWVLYMVTAFHSHVGHVAPYVVDPKVIAGRPFLGAAISDPQNTLQMGTVAAITGLKTPMLDGDLSHAMPDAGALETYLAFRKALAELQQEVDARNATRPLPFPAFSPRCIRCSVST